MHDLQPPFPAIAATAARQHTLITARQLVAHGLTRSRISRWAATGQLEPVAPGVYRLPGSQPTWRTDLLAAVLSSSQPALGSHRAAAVVHGLRGFTPGTIDICSERWFRHRTPEVCVHESLVLPASDRTEIDGIPVTSLVRTLIDLGATSHPDRIGQALDEARRRDQVDLTQVKQRLEELAVQGRNGIAVVRALVDERLGVLLASTGFEQLLVSILDDAGLPMPVAQHKVVDGRFTAHLDFAYPEHRVAIEADSEEYHLDLPTFHHDRSRQNHLTMLGWTMLRYTGVHLHTQQHLVAHQIAQAIGLRGRP